MGGKPLGTGNSYGKPDLVHGKIPWKIPVAGFEKNNPLTHGKKSKVEYKPTILCGYWDDHGDIWDIADHQIMDHFYDP